MRNAGELSERVKVLTLTYDEETDAYSWGAAWGSWAKVEADTRSNLFSSVGIGARGVTFILRENPALTLLHAIKWRGQHCFLTAILHDGEGQMTVKAALVDTVTCRKNVDLPAGDYRFPGVLTEKYVKHEQLEPMATNQFIYVLVVPKDITLRPGSLVGVGGQDYTVLTPHELDAWKNEYEVGRTVDL